MKRETIFSMGSQCRGSFDIEALTFGDGDRATDPEHSVALMGALRGDEGQQLYIASQVVRYLRRFEEQGLIAPGAQIRVIPCGNPFSLNTNTRFWAVDGTGIDRMFPGYDQGETTQRIAAGIFEALKGFGYGIQLTSYYLPGEFVPHVHMMDTGYESIDVARAFGLPYAVIRKPEPVDSGTLNYNWQIWNTKAVSIYSRKTAQIDRATAEQVVFAILRFMMSIGVIRYDLHGGFHTTVVKEEHLINVRSTSGGLASLDVQVGDHVRTDQVIARVYDPLTGEKTCELRSPVMGVAFFSSASPLISSDQIVYRIIADRVIDD